MTEYRFNNGKEYTLVARPKLVVGLNRRKTKRLARYHKIKRIYKWIKYPWYDPVDFEWGFRTEVFDYWVGTPEDKRWLSGMSKDIMAALHPEIAVIGKTKFKGQTYFLCYRYSDWTCSEPMWFNLNEGVEISDD